jgi:hypothetical protein
VSIDGLIGQLQALVDAGLPPGTTVYVPEKTRLNGAGWRSPRDISPGYDPHPISVPHPAPLVVYIS